MVFRATFAAGPFREVASLFRLLPGVQDVGCGYTGGIKDAPQAGEVATGRTGHVEAVEILFNPGQIGFPALLEKFWAIHDPTRMDFTGADAGVQHRSMIFYHDAAQRKAALASMARAQQRLTKPILTLIEPARFFWPAAGENADDSFVPHPAVKAGAPTRTAGV